MTKSVAAGVFVDFDFLNLFFQVLLDRLYVFDSGRFSWNPFSELRFSLCFFILNGSSIFLKKEDCLKKTALSDYSLKNIIIVIFTLIN